MTAIANAGVATYLLGVISSKAQHPSPVTSIQYRGTGVNELEVPAGELWKSVYNCTGMYAVGMQNGILLQAVMGKSATVGAGPYTHTITVPTATGGVLPLLPSFTFYHEKTGTATAWATQYLGCKIASLSLFTSWPESLPLVARADIIAKKPVDPGFTMTNSPALPATANEAGYYFANMTRTFDSVDLDGMTELELTMSPSFTVEFANSWDGATYTGQWARSLIEATRRDYSLRILLHNSTIEDDIWDDLIANGNTKDFVFKWSRSATDYIQATCTDCQIIGHTQTTPHVKDENIEEVRAVPRSITFEVEDQISGATYGE